MEKELEIIRAGGAESAASYITILPGHMQAGMARYLAYGIVTGDFLNALLSGEPLWRVVSRADDINCAALIDWSRYLYNHCPGIAIGSPERVAAWRKAGGFRGLAEGNTL